MEMDQSHNNKINWTVNTEHNFLSKSLLFLLKLHKICAPIYKKNNQQQVLQCKLMTWIQLLKRIGEA